MDAGFAGLEGQAHNEGVKTRIVPIPLGLGGGWGSVRDKVGTQRSCNRELSHVEDTGLLEQEGPNTNAERKLGNPQLANGEGKSKRGSGLHEAETAE